MSNVIYVNGNRLLYSITVDGIEKKVISYGKLDYKAVCRKYYQEGAKSVNIAYLGRVSA